MTSKKQTPETAPMIASIIGSLRPEENLPKIRTREQRLAIIREEEAKVEEVGLVGGADLNLYEVGTMIENITIDYYTTDFRDIPQKAKLRKLYQDLAAHFNRMMGLPILSMSI